jgi:hypothetical protein
MRFADRSGRREMSFIRDMTLCEGAVLLLSFPVILVAVAVVAVTATALMLSAAVGEGIALGQRRLATGQ